MTQYAADAFFINMGYFLVTLLVCRGILGYLNRSTGIRFGDVLKNRICQDSLSAGIYFSARWIGLAIIAAAFLR